VIDGEAVLMGVDRVSDFNRLHSRRYDLKVKLYAFDILVAMATSEEIHSSDTRAKTVVNRIWEDVLSFRAVSAFYPVSDDGTRSFTS